MADVVDSPQTAMMLTQEEWFDLGSIAAHYLGATAWAAKETDVPNTTRCRELARRLMEAAR